MATVDAPSAPLNPQQRRGRQLLIWVSLIAVSLSVAANGLLAWLAWDLKLLFFLVQDLWSFLMLAVVVHSGSRVGKWFMVLWLLLKAFIKFMIFYHGAGLMKADNQGGVVPVIPADCLWMTQIVGVPTALAWVVVVVVLAFWPSVNAYLAYRRGRQPSASAA